MIILPPLSENVLNEFSFGSIIDRSRNNQHTFSCMIFNRKIFILINFPRNGSITFQTIVNELSESKKMAAISASNTSARIFGAAMELVH